MGEYCPSLRYAAKADVEAMIAKGKSGLGLPPSQKPQPVAPLEPVDLNVTIANADAVRAGARLRLDYGPWREALADRTVNAGKHIIDFRDAPGYVTPHPRIIDAQTGRPAELVVTYARTHGEWTAAPGVGRPRFVDGGLERTAVAGDQLVVTGGFSRIDDVPAQNIAAFYEGRWHALGDGLDGKAEALASFGGGVVAGGWFQEPGKAIALWRDGRWTELGRGMNAGVRALAVLDGTLYAGGEFTEAGGVPANHLARWDGRRWQPLGSGTSGTRGVRKGRDGAGWVYALSSFDGKLVVGGNFAEAGGVGANNVALWDPKAGTWSALGSGLDSRVYDLAAYRGELYATGDFTHAGEAQVNYIARWDGRAWKPVSTGLWDPYEPLGRTLLVAGDKLMVGGGFRTAGGVTSRNVALWDGAAFSPMGNGLNRYVESSALYGGKIVAVGWFNHLMEGGPAGWAQWEPR
jgi:hypothetical protein